MSGVNFQYRAFLLMPFLCLCLLKAHGYTLETWTTKNGLSIEIICEKNESLDFISPKKDFKHNINKTLTPTTLSFKYCSPPNKPYLEILKDININSSKVSMLSISEMADAYLLKESLFEGMPIKQLSIDDYYVSINSNNGNLDLTKGSLYRIICQSDNNKLINGKAVFKNRTINVTYVTIHRCTPPNESYSDILLKLNIMPYSVKTLQINFPSKFSSPQPLKGLSLKEVIMNFENIYELNPEVFQGVEVDKVSLYKVEMKTLRTLRAKKAIFEYGNFSGDWGDCPTLTSLKLIGCLTPKTPGGWLHRCRNLTDLTLESPSEEDVEKILLGAHAHTLSIKNCQYDSVTKPMVAENLRSLKIISCSLSYISEGAFSRLQKLEELDLSVNSLSWSQMVQAITPLGNLRKLTTHGNPVDIFCYHRFKYMKPKNMGNWNLMPILNVSTLSLQVSPLSEVCFSNWVNLTYLDLRHNEINSLQLLGLPVPDKRPLTVDLRGNPLKTLPEYDYGDYFFVMERFSRRCDGGRNSSDGLPSEAVSGVSIIAAMQKGPPGQRPNSPTLSLLVALTPSRLCFRWGSSCHFALSEVCKSQNITILMDSKVECDCEHTWYISALRELQIHLENATCKSGERLVDFAGEKFDCDKYPCDNCICRTSRTDETTIVDCDSRSLYVLPAVWQYQGEAKYENGIIFRNLTVKKILASKNLIKTLPVYNYPNSLVEIDLSNNKISRVSESALNALFFGGNRRVNLSGNPFVCDCETQAMLDALSLYRNQIPDYNNLACSDRDSYLRELSHRSLCTERLLLTLGIFALTLLALLTSISLLYFRFKLTIKAFLYARGLCLSCVREEELDADKEYDAFISFASVDDELVAEVLLPGLENDYKICIHTRNWIPGEMIYTQIVKSVEESKRTIIVLSKNFVESLWGMLEFRTAYVSALREGRVRVICIVVDDVIDDMDLDPDLKAYLKSNTYLKLKDPWFWQKLRYALPHPCVEKHPGAQNRNRNGENNCQEIELASRPNHQ